MLLVHGGGGRGITGRIIDTVIPSPWARGITVHLGELLRALVGCAMKVRDSSSSLQQRESIMSHIEGVMIVQMVYKLAHITTSVDYFG